jgi:hypothetical protein
VQTQPRLPYLVLVGRKAMLAPPISSLQLDSTVFVEQAVVVDRSGTVCLALFLRAGLFLRLRAPVSCLPLRYPRVLCTGSRGEGGGHQIWTLMQMSARR